MTASDVTPWRLVVPVKGQLTAKSRLHPPTGVRRSDLAHALALDTLTAVLEGMPPAHLVVVTSDEVTTAFARDRGAAVVPDPGAGLNAAIRKGVQHVLQGGTQGPLAVLLGDLPSLRPADLHAALVACSGHARSFVPDAEGTGTVLLAALDPTELVPRFGIGSAAAHARHHMRLDLDLAALRSDVDDDDALRRAVAMGVGAHTHAVLALAHG